MRFHTTLVLILLLLSYGSKGEDSSVLTVRVHTDSFDGKEIWVGVFKEDVTVSSEPFSWSRENTSEFSVAVPADSDDSTLIFLKKNCVPIVESLTTVILESGLDLKFSNGVSIFGTVTTTAGDRIDEGSVSLDRLHDLEFFTPDPELSSWVIAADGTFEIHGLLPNRKYVVTAVAPDFMPAIAETTLSVDELRQQVNFQLAKATFITGRIEDRYGTAVRGEFETVVAPMESQTTEIHAKFDQEDNFRIGPFAEGVTVGLTAHDHLDRRSKVAEVQTPAADVQLKILRWLTITGNVQHRDTSEAVEEFQIASTQDLWRGNMINVTDPDGHFEVEIDELSHRVSIIATGFAHWESSRYLTLEERDSYDFGNVKLKPAYTVRGRVIDSTTQLPIADADLRRIEYQAGEGNLSHWVFNNIKTTTDINGKFELSGFSMDGDKLSVAQRGYRTNTLLVNDVESELEIELEPRNGSISGRVVSEDGSPIHPAYVSIGGYSERNKEDGSFSFIYLTGKIQLRASADGGRSEVQEITIENGQHITDVELVISEEGLGRLHGTVKGLAEGETARVIVRSIRERHVNSDGTYEVRGIPIGEYEVFCRTSSDREVWKTMEMNETLDTRIDFIFEGRNSISGQIMLAGNPAGALEVQAKPRNEHHVRSHTTTLADGTYVMEGMDEGEYDILVTSRGVSQQVSVSGDTTVDFDLGSIELSGRIQASATVRGVHVYLTGYGGGGRFQLHTTVDSNGFYRFRGLSRGRYQVIVDHDKFRRASRKVNIDNSVQDFDFHIQPKNQ